MRQAARRVIRSGDVVGAATEENNIAEILSDQGDLAGARPLFESARTTWLAAGYRVGAALATSNLGRLEARAGNVARGRALLEEARRDFREIRSPVFIAESEVRLDECLVLEGDFGSAMATSRDRLKGFRGRAGFEQVELTTLRLLGTARVLGELADGTGAESSDWSRELDEAVELATALEAPYELALSLTARSELGLLIDRTRGLPAVGAAEPRGRRSRARGGFIRQPWRRSGCHHLVRAGLR